MRCRWAELLSRVGMASRSSEGGVVGSPVVLITCAGDGSEPRFRPQIFTQESEKEMSSRAKGSVSTERHATSTSPEAVRIEAVAGPVRQTKGTPRCRAISWSESDFRNQRFELPLPAELVHRRAQWRILARSGGANEALRSCRRWAVSQDW
jgi:hypothetical protein